MACPHATTAAAYIKSFQPTWSPAAIKLALMTGNIYIMYSPIMITITIAYSLPFGVLFAAVPMSAEKNVEAEFAYGAGNINPLKAPYPGLIYDMDELDYIKFLCGEDQYNTTLLQIVTGDNSTCSEATIGTVFNLNYPSFALSTSPSESISQVFNRTVTNVGSPSATYKAIVTTPLGLTIKVNPNILSFTSLGQKRSFALTIEGTIDKSIVSASLVWDDDTFQVRSPIVVYVAHEA